MSQEINLATSLRILSTKTHDDYVDATSKKQFEAVIKFLECQAKEDIYNCCECNWNGSLLSETIEKLKSQGLSISLIKGSHALDDDDYYVISWK